MIPHLVAASQPIDPQIAGYIQAAIATLVTALVGILVVSLRRGVELGFKYLEQKIGADSADIVRKEAATLVRYFEQSPAFKDIANEQKKEMAIISLTKFCEAKGLPFDHAFFDKAIEEAVHIVKTELNLSVETATLEPWDVPTSGQQ